MQLYTIVVLLFLVLAGTASIPAAAAAEFSGCTPKINWFPTYNEIGTTETLYVIQSDGITAVACEGDAVCNSPPVWSFESQQQAADDTNSAGVREVFKVAFKQYHTLAGPAAQPTLYFKPYGPLFDAASVDACVEGARLVTPGTWSYNVAVGNATAQTGSKVGRAGRIVVPQLPWADNDEQCATVSVMVSGYSLTPKPAGFPNTFTSNYPVCWYRHDGQASADFQFLQCSDSFAVNVTSVKPLARYLTQGADVVADSNGLPAMLFQPVIQIFGSMRKTVNGTVLADTPEYNGEGAVYVINKYLLVPPETTAADVITVLLDTGDLAEGYYKLYAKVSVVSKFPGLVDLQGKAEIKQEDMGEVLGYTEYMAFLVRNASNESVPLVGFQRKQRKVQLSDINSNKVGKAIAAGDSIIFSWQFYGVGLELCYHDSELLTACRSPLVLKARPFTNATKQHTFSVSIRDVCGNTNAANFTYTVEGVTSLSVPDYVDPLVMIGMDSMLLTASGNGTKLSIKLGASSAMAVSAGWFVKVFVALVILLCCST